jgi:hypothetical protein
MAFLRYLIVLLWAFNPVFFALGQSETAKLDSLVDKHVKINQSNKTMPGYRIQVYFGQQRSKAMEIKSDFELRYGGIPVYLTYKQPNFKVRAGDFKTKLEASKYLNDIKSSYAVAFIVKDDVKLPEVNSDDKQK